MPTEGVVYIAYGETARQEVLYSITSLRESNPTLAVAYFGEPGLLGLRHREVYLGGRFPEFAPAYRARFMKTCLYQYTPYDTTLYLDADTRVYGDLSPIFDILRDGWEMVITPAQQHGADWLWHVDAAEREYTAECLGYYAQIMQGGVFGFRKTPAVESFFVAWAREWEKFKDEDQGALIRALHTSPVRVWLLGKPYNGGAVVSHLYGRTRAAK